MNWYKEVIRHPFSNCLEISNYSVTVTLINQEIHFETFCSHSSKNNKFYFIIEMYIILVQVVFYKPVTVYQRQLQHRGKPCTHHFELIGSSAVAGKRFLKLMLPQFEDP